MRVEAGSPRPIGAAVSPEQAGPESPAISSEPIAVSLHSGTMIVPPFRIRRFGRTYRSPTELRIDLGTIAPGQYRLVAVHNFQLEDRNPDLNECLAGIFLAARRADGGWEEAESFPVECRTLAVIGTIEIAAATG